MESGGSTASHCTPCCRGATGADRESRVRVELLHGRGEDLFHQAAAARAGRGLLILVAAAVGPDRVRDAAVRGEALVVSLLVAVVDAGAGEEAVAVVLVGADVADPRAGAEGRAVAAHQVDVGHV